MLVKEILIGVFIFLIPSKVGPGKVTKKMDLLWRESWAVGSMGEVRPWPEGHGYPKGLNVPQETRDTGVVAKVGEVWLPQWELS